MCWLKRIVHYLQLVSVSEMVCQYIFHFWSACMLTIFLYELTLCPGKLWHFGLESRKMQKDKAHTIPLLHPSITSIQVPWPEGSSMAYRQWLGSRVTVGPWDRWGLFLEKLSVMSLPSTLHSAGPSTSRQGLTACTNKDNKTIKGIEQLL